MKRALNVLVLLCLLCGMTSCLKSNLDELETYGGANITSVSRVEYRYVSDEIAPSSGQNVVKYVTLEYSGSTVDMENATVTIPVKLPANFPESELGKVSASNLVVVVTLSTAARIEPVNGAPALGKPGDWSMPNEYKVTAANGTSRIWTIKVTGI